jgi:hypothetical protein
MNARKATLLLIALFLLLAFTTPIASQQGDRIIINYADEVRESWVSMAQDLTYRLTGVGPRIVLQYANQLRHIDLPAVPGALQILLEQVSDRVIFQYANTNRQEEMVYPAILINDTSLPQISDIAARMTGSDTAIITWTTNEFADSAVIYGTQPGVYPQTVSDPLYTKQHEITLIGLMSGPTYYYKVRSTDRSDNTTTSLEHSFTAQQVYVYLPLVMRNSL